MEEFNDVITKTFSYKKNNIPVEKEKTQDEYLPGAYERKRANSVSIPYNNPLLSEASENKGKIEDNEPGPVDVLRMKNLQLQRDYGSASIHFKAFKHSLRELTSYTFNYKKSDEEYDRLIQDAYDTAKSYLEFHNCKMNYAKANAREKCAMDVINALNQLTEKRNALLYKKQDDEIKDDSKIQNDDMAELERLARLQKNIGRINFVKNKKIYNSNKRAKLPWYKILKNKLYGVVTSILGNTIGGAVALVSLFTSPVKKVVNTNEPVKKYFWDNKSEQEIEKIKTAKELEKNNAEPFDENTLLIDNLPEEDDDQEIQERTNKIPAVWEVEVPEPADQPPTVSLDIEQGIEGNDLGFDRGKNVMGHAFITVSYTRTDPYTKQKKRYVSQFGFYPKGGIGRTGIAAVGELQHGIHIPGQMTNDFGHQLNTGMKFTVTNRQVNRLFDFTSTYEQGGYNYVKRNCTTFVHDAAEHIGIRTDDIFKQSYYRTNGLTGGFALASLGSLYIRVKSKSDIQNERLKDDYSIQKLGQKKATEQDVVNLDNTEFNMDIYGYSPSHTGETMRVNKNYRIHSNKVAEKYQGDGETESKSLANSYRKVLFMSNNFPGMINEYLQDKGVDANQQLDRLSGFCTIISEMLSQHMENLGFNTGDDFSVFDVNDITVAKKKIFDAVAAINARVDEINEIYADVFQKDSGLNLLFSGYVATLEEMKEGYYKVFKNLNEMRFTNLSDIKKIAGDSISPDDDAYQAKLMMLHGMVKIKMPDNDFYLSASQMMVLKKLFGSVRRGIDALQLYEKFDGGVKFKKGKVSFLNDQSKESYESLSDAEKELLNECRRKRNVIDELDSYEKDFINIKDYSKSDINTVFNGLAFDLENDYMDERTGDEVDVTASQVYSSIVFGNIFKGTKAKAKSLLSSSFMGPLKTIAKKYNGKEIGDKPTRFNNDFLEELNAPKEKVAAELEMFLLEKMKNNELFEQIIEIYIKNIAAIAAADNNMNVLNKADLDEMSVNICYTALNKLRRALVDSFVIPLINDIQSELYDEYMKVLKLEMSEEQLKFINLNMLLKVKDVDPFSRMLDIRVNQNTKDELLKANRGSLFEKIFNRYDKMKD